MPMTREEYLLTCLMEEAAEVTQRAAKAERFGMAEVQPGQAETNAERLFGEVLDFVAVHEMIAGPFGSLLSPLFPNDLPPKYDARIREKMARVEGYIRRAREEGLVVEKDA